MDTTENTDWNHVLNVGMGRFSHPDRDEAAFARGRSKMDVQREVMHQSLNQSLNVCQKTQDNMHIARIVMDNLNKKAMGEFFSGTNDPDFMSPEKITKSDLMGNIDNGYIFNYPGVGAYVMGATAELVPVNTETLVASETMQTMQTMYRGIVNNIKPLRMYSECILSEGLLEVRKSSLTAAGDTYVYWGVWYDEEPIAEYTEIYDADGSYATVQSGMEGVYSDFAMLIWSVEGDRGITVKPLARMSYGPYETWTNSDMDVYKFNHMLPIQLYVSALRQSLQPVNTPGNWYTVYITPAFSVYRVSTHLGEHICVYFTNRNFPKSQQQQTQSMSGKQKNIADEPSFLINMASPVNLVKKTAPPSMGISPHQVTHQSTAQKSTLQAHPSYRDPKVTKAIHQQRVRSFNTNFMRQTSYD